MDGVYTTDNYVELKRHKPSGKLTADCCTGNSAYHPRDQHGLHAPPKRIAPSVQRKLVLSVVKHGVDAVAQREADRLANIQGGGSNVGMRSALARAGSSSKTTRFLATNADIDADIDNGPKLSPLPSTGFAARSKGTRKLVGMRRAMRNR